MQVKILENVTNARISKTENLSHESILLYLCEKNNCIAFFIYKHIGVISCIWINSNKKQFKHT